MTEFRCVECLGTGRVNCSGNEPRARFCECDVCRGSGYLSAQDFLDYAMSELRVARKALHQFGKQPYLREKFKASANHWLLLAKEARAKVLEAHHAGARHIAA